MRFCSRWRQINIVELNRWLMAVAKGIVSETTDFQRMKPVLVSLVSNKETDREKRLMPSLAARGLLRPQTCTAVKRIPDPALHHLKKPDVGQRLDIMMVARFALAGQQASTDKMAQRCNGGNHFETQVAAFVTSGNVDLRHNLHECVNSFNQRGNLFGSAQRQTAKRQLFSFVAVACAVLVYLTAIIREKRIDFAVTGELAAISFRNALQGVLNLPSFGFGIISKRSHSDCTLVPAISRNELF